MPEAETDRRQTALSIRPSLPKRGFIRVHKPRKQIFSGLPSALQASILSENRHIRRLRMGRIVHFLTFFPQTGRFRVLALDKPRL